MGNNLAAISKLRYDSDLQFFHHFAHAVLQGHEPVVHQGAGAVGGVLQTLRGGAGRPIQEVSQRISWPEITVQKKVQ